MRIESEAKKERERIDAEARAKIAAVRKAEEERFARLVSQAKTPTETLMRTGTVILTDVHLGVRERYSGQAYTFSFGRYFELHATSCRPITTEALRMADQISRTLFVKTRPDCQPGGELQVWLDHNQRGEVISKTMEAVRRWRVRFPNMPSYPFQ